MKKILLLGTGGTIASADTGDGLTPGMDGADFLRYVPAVKDLCQVDCLQVCNIDSTNMTPRHWLQLARAVEEHYDGYDGFVVSHGTDTMAYTAAALSCLIQGSPKPIVLTGSQKPIQMDITDSKTNLLDSFAVACDGRIPGVTVVFGGAVIAGTRARKTYSKSYGAFSSINYPVLGVVQEGHLLPYLCPRAAVRPVFYHDLETNVSLVKLIPGLSPDYLAFALEHSRGVLIESFGVGGIPDRMLEKFYQEMERWAEKGKFIVMATQVVNEGSNMEIYQVGQRVKKDFQLIEAYDMTLEATLTKLMYLMARYKGQYSEIRRGFYREINHDILCAREDAE